MPDPGPDEARTFRWHILELFVQMCWVIGGCILIYPFAAVMFLNRAPGARGYWPPTVTGPLLALPIFCAGFCINYLLHRLKISVNPDGISWTTVFQSHEIRWDEINYIAESPKYFFSLIVDTKTKRWTIPLIGILSVVPLRKMIGMRNLKPPIDLVLSQSRTWRFGKALILFCTLVLLLSAGTSLAGVVWSPPFDKGHSRILGTLSLMPVFLFIHSIGLHLPALSTSMDIVGDCFVYKNDFKKAIRIPLDQITSIHFHEDATRLNRKLVVSSQMSEATIQENYPNLELIAKELSRRTGVKVREPNEAIT